MYTGNFRDHWPHGRCKIQLPDGSLYDGNVIKGVKEGKGTLINLERQVYEGDFKNELKEGQGVISVQGSNYHFESEFKEDKPVFEANKILFMPPKKQEEEEVKDPKAKGGAKGKKGQEEEQVDDGRNKIQYEYVRAKEGEEEKPDQKEIEFELHIVFQAEAYEDLNPSTEEEKKPAKGKGAKPTDEPEIRMITPDPVVMEKESGRLFEILMGRNEKFRLNPTPSQADAESQGTANAEEKEQEYEERWVNYRFDQSSASLNC